MRKTESEALEPPMSEIVPMVQRVEFAAMQELQRTGNEKFEACMPDPRYGEYPEDSFDWMMLFARAMKISRNLASLLYYLRGGGCRICEDPQYGARILWNGPWTQEELSAAKECLMRYKGEMIFLLAELRWPGGINPDQMEKKT